MKMVLQSDLLISSESIIETSFLTANKHCASSIQIEAGLSYWACLSRQLKILRR